jgi:hypothetical protein
MQVSTVVRVVGSPFGEFEEVEEERGGLWESCEVLVFSLLGLSFMPNE